MVDEFMCFLGSITERSVLPLSKFPFTQGEKQNKYPTSQGAEVEFAKALKSAIYEPIPRLPRTGLKRIENDPQ